MKTKRVTYYVCLYSGWQDGSEKLKPLITDDPVKRLTAGSIQMAIEVDLPEIPQLETIQATVKEITQ